MSQQLDSFIEKALASPLFVATGCSWRRILFNSGEPVLLPVNDKGVPVLEAENEVLTLFTAAPALIISTFILKEAFQTILSSGSVKQISDILGFAKKALLNADGAKLDTSEVKHINIAKPLLERNPIIDGLLDDPIVVNQGDGVTTGQCFKTHGGHLIAQADLHRVDNHPDIVALDPYILRAFAASPELYEATRWLLAKTESAIDGKKIKDADEVILFANKALEKLDSRF